MRAVPPRITNFDDCTKSQGIVSNRSGSKELRPETAENLSLGGTFQLNMGAAGRLTFTTDYWEIRQKNVIGLFGDSNALILDYLLRLQGSSNPNRPSVPIRRRTISTISRAPASPPSATSSR